MEEENLTEGGIKGVFLPPSFFARLKVLKPYHIADFERALAQVGPSGRVNIFVEHGEVSAIIAEAEESTEAP